jgi:hypothetical protein
MNKISVIMNMISVIEEVCFLLHWQVWEWFYYRYSKTYLHFSA